MGKVPTCRCYHGKIHCHEPQTTFQRQTNNTNDSTKSWMKIMHFHFKCFQGLEEHLWDKLIAILESSNEYHDEWMFDNEWKQQGVDEILEAK